MTKRRSDALAARAAVTAMANEPAQKRHGNVLRSNTGWAIDPVVWVKRAKAMSLLTAQTERIAEALTRAGVDVRRESGLTMISAVTGIVETMTAYRACRFLPTIAARDRRPLVNGLKLFITGHPKSKYFRYSVMTSSEPVPAFGDLRKAIQKLNRRISKWAHYINTAVSNDGGGYDVKVLFRGIEFTRATAEERGMSDRYPPETVLYHIHANVIYWPTRAMRSGEWKCFLRATHRFMKAEWRDNGKVEKVEEIVKYCSKPNDTLAASDDELVWLYRETQRLKICQPLGDFKAWMKTLEERKEKVVRVHLGRGDGRLERVKKGKRERPVDEDDDAGAEDAAAEGGEVPEKPERRERNEPGEASPPTNIVIGLSLPQWRHSPWSEPMIMVQHYDPLRLSEEATCDIAAWKEKAREWWDDAFAPPPEEALRVARMAMDESMSDEDIRAAAEAAPYILDTCRPTVPTGTLDHLEECEIEDENELDDDVKSIVRLFEGATVVRLRPRPPTEDDGIPFETDEQAEQEAELRAMHEADEPGWAKRRLSAPYHPSERWGDSRRIAA
ncbi:hypothetical protein HLH89_06385 [Rhizobium laguerreae]|uniref:hypothetical protein n=1 Tax=Rhizobium laguerreae TaxID=1076926 RepID=UPI0014788950|nr:hypothetical protein [Rhizobium laguerreae]NNH80657.1 hypothetical protein [Rhizobium laguerreae]